MTHTPEKTSPTPENMLAEILAPVGYDRIIEAITHPDELNHLSFPIQVRLYYDLATDSLRNELDGKGIGYREGLTEIDGIERISEESFRQQVEDLAQTPERRILTETRLDMSIVVDAVQTDESAFLKTDLFPNTHGIVSTGPKFYRLTLRHIPPVYRDKYPNPDIERIAGFNIGMVKPAIFVDLINR